MSSRIRLARNLAKFPFPPVADDEVRAETQSLLKQTISTLTSAGPLDWIPVGDLAAIDRQLLVERQLISREHSETHGPRGVGVAANESVSLMVNEEDHLRMQVLRSGFELEECWDETNRLDDEIEQSLDFAFDNDFGYLTSCPTNVGTGIRVSVMMHLPALVLTKEIQKVFQALHKMGLAVRGLYGEGSQSMGDFYQISNQATLGKAETDIVKDLQTHVPEIVTYERKVRQALMKESAERLRDQVSRAYGILRSAHQITSEEAMHLLSNLRMGISLNLVEGVTLGTVNELFVHTQPAHLQKRHPLSGPAPSTNPQKKMENAERNASRASYLRERLAVA